MSTNDFYPFAHQKSNTIVLENLEKKHEINSFNRFNINFIEVITYVKDDNRRSN